MTLPSVKTSKPLVAICCITYNHESYIRDALEGFIMQQTNFPFVAIVHDDKSTDGTAGIIREYAEKYPDIIVPIYETENQFSKRDDSLGRILREAIKATGAKYVAHCEGDDYWTDPHKLQKQVDFLESHLDYSMVFANTYYHFEDGRKYVPNNLENRTYKPIELYQSYICHTPTVVHRIAVYDSPIYLKLSLIKQNVFGDITLFLSCGTIGKIYGCEDVVSHSNILSTGASQYIKSHPYDYLMNRLALSRFFGKEYIQIDKMQFIPYFVRAIHNITQSEYRKLAFALMKLSLVGCVKQLRHFFNPIFINWGE